MKVILPIVCAALMVLAIKAINPPNYGTTGYIISAAIGLIIGVLISKVYHFFKKEAAGKNDKNSVAK